MTEFVEVPSSASHQMQGPLIAVWQCSNTALLFLLLLAACRLARRSRGRLQLQPILRFQVGSGRHLQQAKRSTKAVRFATRVQCNEVLNLSDAPEEWKHILWWNAEDFNSFKETRLLIARTYRDVAKKKGMPYSRTFPVEPSVSHESRRGLAMERAVQRQERCKAHIAAILKEQAALKQPSADSKKVPADEILRTASLQHSGYDSYLAIETAHRDYRLSMAQSNDDAHAAQRQRSKTGVDDPQDSPSELPDEIWKPMQRAASFDLAESDENLKPHAAESRGFGLSRQTLEDSGLSASGHDMPPDEHSPVCENSDSDDGEVRRKLWIRVPIR